MQPTLQISIGTACLHNGKGKMIYIQSNYSKNYVYTHIHRMQ